MNAPLNHQIILQGKTTPKNLVQFPAPNPKSKRQNPSQNQQPAPESALRCELLNVCIPGMQQQAPFPPACRRIIFRSIARPCPARSLLHVYPCAQLYYTSRKKRPGAHVTGPRVQCCICTCARAEMRVHIYLYIHTTSFSLCAAAQRVFRAAAALEHTGFLQQRPGRSCCSDALGGSRRLGGVREARSARLCCVSFFL